MKRRDILKGGIAAAVATGAAAISAPAIARDKIEITMVSTWPRDFPGLGTGAQRFADRLTQMTDGRITVNYFAANERVKAFDSFDEVVSSNTLGGCLAGKCNSELFKTFATVALCPSLIDSFDEDSSNTLRFCLADNWNSALFRSVS